MSGPSPLTTGAPSPAPVTVPHHWPSRRALDASTSELAADGNQTRNLWGNLRASGRNLSDMRYNWETMNRDFLPSHLVVRVRIGIDFDRGSLEPHRFMEAVTKRLESLGEEMDVDLDVLQVGVGGDPRWRGVGPENGVGRPIH